MRSGLFKCFLFLTVFVLSGCNGRYASLGKSMSDCGFWTASYSKFHNCMEPKVTAQNSKNPNDYYNRTSAEIVAQLDFFGVQVDKKLLTDKEGFAGFRDFVNQKIVEEQESAQVAGAIVAVGVLGAAAASCANTGGCGGGYSNSYYDGNCPCPYSLDVDGNICGERSAYSRSGGASPICY